MLPFIGLERVGETVVTAPTKDAEADFAAIHHAPNHPRPPTTLNYSDFWPPELQGQDTKFDISTRPPPRLSKMENAYHVPVPRMQTRSPPWGSGRSKFRCDPLFKLKSISPQIYSAAISRHALRDARVRPKDSSGFVDADGLCY